MRASWLASRALGIQTTNRVDGQYDAALVPASAATYLTAAGTQQLIRFDPNGATDGNIDASLLFRIGVFVSLSSGSTLVTGTIQLQGFGLR